MKKGVMVIVTTDDSEDSDNPKRTGRIFLISDKGIRKLVSNKEVRENILKTRYAFITESFAKEIGFPDEKDNPF